MIDVGVHAAQAPADVQQPLGHDFLVHWQAPPKHSRLVPHEVSSGAEGVEQTPVLELQTPCDLHSAGAGQVTAAPGVHTPLLQVSSVHASPSMEHAVSSFLFG